MLCQSPEIKVDGDQLQVSKIRNYADSSSIACFENLNCLDPNDDDREHSQQIARSRLYHIWEVIYFTRNIRLENKMIRLLF